MERLISYLDGIYDSLVFNLLCFFVCIIFSVLMLAFNGDVSIGWIYFSGFATGYWFLLAFWKLYDRIEHLFTRKRG